MSKKTVKVVSVIIAVIFILGIVGPLLYSVFAEPADEALPIEQRIEASEKRLEELKIKYDELNKKEEDFYRAYGRRFRIMCEKGRLSYLDVVFSSKDFSDFTDRVVIAKELLEYDKKVMDSIKEIKEELATAKAEEENTINELLELKAELEGLKAE